MAEKVEKPKKRRVIEADEIRVGPILIMKDDKGGAGIYIGDSDGPMISLYVAADDEPSKVGIGIFAKEDGGIKSPMAVALTVDKKDGGGVIQFARGEEAYWLTFEQIRRMALEN